MGSPDGQYRSDQACGDGRKVRCAEALAATRTLMGPAQERWLERGLRSSRARWNVLANQVMVAPARSMQNEQDVFGMDRWDGYVAAQQRLTRLLGTARQSNPVVITGDVHSNWVADLKQDVADPDSPTVASEFVGTSISSGGDGNDAPSPMLRLNPHLKFFQRAAWLRARQDYAVALHGGLPHRPLRVEAGRRGRNARVLDCRGRQAWGSNRVSRTIIRRMWLTWITPALEGGPTRVIAMVAVLALAGATEIAARADWPLTIVTLPSPAAGESAQPQLSASEHGLILSWIERAGPTATLKFARRTASGWSEPRTVASGSDWFVNWADVPSVIGLADGTLAAHWLQKSGSGTYAYDVRLSFSKDDGKTWTPSVTPHHDGTQTEHGFASLVLMPAADGGLGLVWLDGRAMKATPGGHGGHGGGDMALRFAAFDRNGKQTAETAVDTRVCECCPTAAAVTADGVIAAYRDRSAEEVRDIFVARLENGKWNAPVAVHNDGWEIPACPVNGPMLSARGPNVAIAWYTMKNEKGHAQVAFSKDGGRSFGAPVALADADTIGRVDVALLDDGSAVASWIEVVDTRAEFRIRRADPAGGKSASITVAQIEAGRSSGYPRIAQHGDELVFAWTARDGGLKVQTAVAKLGG